MLCPMKGGPPKSHQHLFAPGSDSLYRQPPWFMGELLPSNTASYPDLIWEAVCFNILVPSTKPLAVGRPASCKGLGQCISDVVNVHINLDIWLILETWNFSPCSRPAESQSTFQQVLQVNHVHSKVQKAAGWPLWGLQWYTISVLIPLGSAQRAWARIHTAVRQPAFKIVSSSLVSFFLA